MPVRLSICICTFKRPALLSALLQDLQRVAWDGLDAECEIVVVDNDPALSATAVLADWSTRSRLPLVADAFGQSNIASARNRLVSLAKGERILFLDDDQHPHDPHWLMAMSEAMDQFQADAVFGAVRPLFEANTPDWIRHAGHFDMDPAGMSTGTEVTKDLAHCGNSLIRRRCFEAVSPPFNTDYGLTGGEDSVFFQQLLTKGFRLIWCADGAVSEYVPPQRATARWLLTRTYREGQTWARTEMLRHVGLAQLYHGGLLLLRAVALLAVSLGLLVVWIPFSAGKRLHWSRKCVGQLGKISHFFGGRFAEYG